MRQPRLAISALRRIARGMEDMAQTLRRIESNQPRQPSGS